MRPVVYYVASSLDGFIARLNYDIDGFIGEGSGVQQYLADLQSFDTVIMGRNTYEFGYRYGLVPGQPAYPHMRHYIFSNNLKLQSPHPQVHVCPMNIEIAKQLKEENGRPIYLCGGGEFAGWLLDHQLIDILKIKLNPLILGDGIKMFGKSTSRIQTELIDSKRYEYGLQIMEYQIKYR